MEKYLMFVILLKFSLKQASTGGYVPESNRSRELRYNLPLTLEETLTI